MNLWHRYQQIQRELPFKIHHVLNNIWTQSGAHDRAFNGCVDFLSEQKMCIDAEIIGSRLDINVVEAEIKGKVETDIGEM